MIELSKDRPVVLVDGSSYLFRAFHALPPLTTSTGQPTGAIKGVISMIRRLQQDYSGSPIAVVFDPRGKTFRHEMYEDYKANRPEMPEELAGQIKPIHDIIRAMGLPLLIEEGMEADDVIGTLANEATDKGVDVIISTGDKDMAQLVSNHVSLINTMNDTAMDRDGVIEKFGVKPEQIVDYLALVGDSVDNIPGVTKCGPKTAVKWLQQYGDLDNLMAHADEVGGKIGDNLRAALDQLPLSRDLARIRTELDLGYSVEALDPEPVDRDQLLEQFREMEFRGWIQELENASDTDSPASPAPGQVSTDYRTVLDQQALDAWLDTLRQVPAFAFDTETTSLNYMEARIVGVSFAVEAGTAAYVPLTHSYLGAPEQLDREQVLEQLQPRVQSLGPEFWSRLQHYFTIPEPTGLAREILAAAHLYASQWEVQLIQSINTWDEELAEIEATFEQGLATYKHLQGVSQLMDEKHNALGRFLRQCGQLRFQKRWSQTPRIPETSVLGHMFIVACYAYFFSLANKACPLMGHNNFFAGLFHDLPELLTRDIISPVKRSVAKIGDLIREYEEHEVQQRVLGLLDQGGYGHIARRLHYFLGMEFGSEFLSTVVAEDGAKCIQRQELMNEYNKDRFDPKDGELLKVCDSLAAFIEAYTAMRNGITTDQLSQAVWRIRRDYNQIDLGNGLHIGSLLADFD